MPADSSDITNFPGGMDPSSNYGNLIRCLAAINSLVKSLSERGLKIPSESKMGRLLQLAADLEKLSAECLSGIKHKLDINDFTIILRQAHELARLASLLMRVYDNPNNFFGEPLESTMHNHFPIHDFELCCVHMTDLYKIAHAYFYDVAAEMFILAVYRFYSEREINLVALQPQDLATPFKEICKLANEIKDRFAFTHDYLCERFAEIEMGLNSELPPPSHIATNVLPFDQSLIPQLRLISGFCSGDARLTIQAKSPLSLTPSSAAAFMQLKRSSEHLFDSNSYLIQLERAGVEYKTWAQKAFQILFAVFETNIEHSDSILMHLNPGKPEQGLVIAGHTLSVFKVQDAGKKRYYYRDANFGVFEINTLEDFAEWFGTYLEKDHIEQIQLNVQMPWELQNAQDHLSKTLSSPLCLLTRYARKDSFSANELLKIDPNKLPSNLHKFIYCMFILKLDFTETQELIPKAVSVLNSVSWRDQWWVLIALAVTLQQGYNALARSDETNAFHIFNDILSNHRTLQILNGLSPIDITEEGLDLENVWRSKQWLRLKLKQIKFTSPKPIIFGETCRLARGTHVTSPQLIENALLFSRLSKQQRAEQSDFEYSAMIAKRNDSQNARAAFDRRFGLMPC